MRRIVDDPWIGRTFRRPHGITEYKVLQVYPGYHGHPHCVCQTQKGRCFVSLHDIKHMIDITLRPEWS